MSLMYLHLRPASREELPFDDLDDDILMEIDAASTHHDLANTEPDIHSTIMAQYRALGVA